MNQEKTIQDILEVVTYLKDNMVSGDKFEERTKNFATKDDLKDFATKDDLKDFATKDDLLDIKEELHGFVTQDYLDDKLFEIKNELMNHIDGFIGLHHKLDIEFTSLRATVNRLEEEIQAMKKQMQMN